MKILKTNGELLIDLPQFDNIKDAVMHCVLNEINLSCADLRGADLRDTNLSRADLSHADLRDIDLSCANLSCANLWGANLRGTNLWGADLSCANLWGADLWGANLRCANLNCTNLSFADLSCANLWGADTQYCYRFGHFSKIGGRSCLYYKPIETEPFYLVIAGCFSGTLDEFEEACNKTYPNDPVQAYEAQIAYLRTILK